MTTRARKRRLAAAAAAKERRTKIVALAGVVILAALLFVQGPRILDAFGGGGGATEAVPAPPTQTAENEPQTPAAALGAAVDPFAARRLVDADPKPGAVASPTGTRDPFKAVAVASAAPVTPPPATAPAKPQPTQAPSSPLPNQIVIGKPGQNATARRGWIVILASIQTASGRGVAERFAARARREGLTSIGILESSTQRPLRSGYFVVYNGPYETLAAVQRAAEHVHAFGYRTAYVREILRY